MAAVSCFDQLIGWELTATIILFWRPRTFLEVKVTIKVIIL